MDTSRVPQAHQQSKPEPLRRRDLRREVEFRLRRRELQKALRAVGSYQHAHAFCGRPRIRWDQPEEVEVWMGEEEGSRRAFYVGVLRCHESLICPICAMAHALREAEAIEKAIQKWVEVDGGSLVFATFTLQHSWGEPAPSVVERLRRAFKRMTSSRRWKETVGVHYKGFARGFEMTLGPNGWHPHYHVVFFFYPGEEREVSAEEVFALWSDAVAKEGGKAVLEAFDWQVYSGGVGGGGAGGGEGKVDAKRLARYVRKWDPTKEEDEGELPRGGVVCQEGLKEGEASSWGLGREVAGGTVKAKTQGLSPWDLLLLAAWEKGVRLTYNAKLGQALQKAKTLGLENMLKGSGRTWGELWMEYTKAVYRLRPTVWTPGLKKAFEALANFFKKKPSGQKLGVLNSIEYRTLLGRGETETFLLVVERKGWEKACEFLDMLRILVFGENRRKPPPPRDPPEPSKRLQEALVESSEGKWSYVPGEWPCVALKTSR